jgi:hypothetical protein
LNVDQLRQIAAKKDRYQTQLSRLLAAKKQSSCIEAAVSSAMETLACGTRSFVIYGEPQSGKTEMMICLSAYIADMRAALKEVSRVLAPGGRAVYVVGENVVRGVYVRNSKLLRLLAESLGLRFEKSVRRALPPNRRYLPPPTNGRQSLDSRMRSEIVLQFRKRR